MKINNNYECKNEKYIKDLEVGSTFLYEGQLHILTEKNEETYWRNRIFNLEKNEPNGLTDIVKVIPVNSEISYTYTYEK